MNTVRAALIALVFLFPAANAVAAPRPETLQFERVIDGATVVASGRTIGFWGIKALDPVNPASFAANMYLKTMLEKGTLRCVQMSAPGQPVLWHCTNEGADVGSLMVQMGMARAANSYYRYEETVAQAKGRGVWHN